MMCTSQDTVPEFSHTSVPHVFQMSLQRTDIVPASLGNNNWYGYVQRWIYEVGRVIQGYRRHQMSYARAHSPRNP